MENNQTEEWTEMILEGMPLWSKALTWKSVEHNLSVLWSERSMHDKEEMTTLLRKTPSF
jgi:hypothetical protein